MARKTEQEVEGVAVAAEPVAEPEPAQTPYELLSWNGMPMWRCRLCPWDTLEGEAAFYEHLQAEHVVHEPPPMVVISVYDRYGNLVR